MAGKKGMHWAKRTVDADSLAEIRNKIEAGKIVTALKTFIYGDSEMEPHQVTAALGLLRKVVPDLSSTELVGNADKPLTIEHVESIASRLLPELAARDTGTAVEQPTVN